MSYTNVPKPTGTPYTNVNTVVPSFDEATLTYDEATIVYDSSADYTNLSKPTFLDQKQLDVDFAIGSRFGDTTKQQAAQTFKPSVTDYLGNFYLKLIKVGSPSDNVRLQIYTNGSGAPGSLLATSTIPASSLNNSDFTVINYKFTGPTLTAETTYWAVLNRTGSLNDSNYYRYGYGGGFGVDRYPRGESYYYNGASWTSNDGGGFTFDAYFQEYFNSWINVSKP